MPEPMLKVGAAEAPRHFGLYRDRALCSAKPAG